jgi:hypothetical protein
MFWCHVISCLEHEFSDKCEWFSLCPLQCTNVSVPVNMSKFHWNNSHWYLPITRFLIISNFEVNFWKKHLSNQISSSWTWRLKSKIASSLIHVSFGQSCVDFTSSRTAVKWNVICRNLGLTNFTSKIFISGSENINFWNLKWSYILVNYNFRTKLWTCKYITSYLKL